MQVVWSEIMAWINVFFSQNTANGFTLDKHEVKLHSCQNHNKISNIKSKPWDKKQHAAGRKSEDVHSFSEGEKGTTRV